MILTIFFHFWLLIISLLPHNQVVRSNFCEKKYNLMDNQSISTDLKLELKILNTREILVKITNVSQQMIRAYSHVIGEEKHYDNFEIEAITPDYEHLYFSFYDDRLRSAPVIVELQAQESFEHTIDFLAWANRQVNRATLQTAGLNHLSDFKALKLRAKYRNSPCQNCNEYYKSIWTGFVYSDWIKGN
jgi:hypothetical protein